MKKLLLLLIAVCVIGCKKDTTPEPPPFVVADYPIELEGEWKCENSHYRFMKLDEWGNGFFGCKFFLPDEYEPVATYGGYNIEMDNIYLLRYRPENGSTDSIQLWHLLSLKNDTLQVGQIMNGKNSEHLYFRLNPSSK